MPPGGGQEPSRPQALRRARGRGGPASPAPTASILGAEERGSRSCCSACRTQDIRLQATLVSLDILPQDKNLLIHLLVSIPIQLFLERSRPWEAVHTLEHHQAVDSQG
ncbi:hypothetical protein Y1Q_0005162 [Alligator mississippiensis]|uniref:Uncharacterized protein n=1 Tax=Alligator mississippiensis TaxID=8496 RepID=A0A151MSU8_ALLMI|nr:hypothetical protein Y1Q_0005162 [Alligator mississippiensis]